MIGFIGLTHLGINSSIAVAARGFEVLGFDPQTSLTSQLNQGQFPIHEPGLQDLYNENRDRIRFTSDRSQLKNCSLVYVSLDVPTDQHNQSNVNAIESLIFEYSENLAPGTILVVLSQVPPGFSRPLWKKFQQKNLNYFYQVETLIFGRAVDRALNPERYIIGCANPKNPLPDLYEKLLKAFDCPILKMEFESAELTKTAINFYLTSTVCVTNTLAEICENIGAKWTEVVPALQLDKRIGPHAYLTPGLGLAGGNLERDLITIQNISREFGTESSVIDAWILNSSYRKQWVLRKLFTEISSQVSKAKIGIWGLAYKVGTHSLKNAPSLQLLNHLTELTVQAYDPEAKLPPEYSTERCKQMITPEEACAETDGLVILTPYDQFKTFDLGLLASLMKGRVLIDPYAILDSKLCQDYGFKYFTLGAKSC